MYIFPTLEFTLLLNIYLFRVQALRQRETYFLSFLFHFLETRNNPGWYLPDDDSANGVSILRRNMPLLAEFFDVFIFGTKSRVSFVILKPFTVLKRLESCSGRIYFI